jgi:hypothetical protein
MMKFENTAQSGDRLKAFDFQPMEGREDRFVVGTVVEKVEFGTSYKEESFFPYSCYVVKCEDSSHDQYELGQEVFVPYEVGFMEYDERVKKL